MQVFNYLCNVWRRKALWQKVSWSGLLLIIAYLPWHWLFVNGIVPGPFLLAVFLHEFFFWGFWGLLLIMLVGSLILPVFFLKGIHQRWLKVFYLAPWSIAALWVLLPLLFRTFNNRYALAVYPMLLAFFFSMVWLLVATLRFPERIDGNSLITFSLIALLTIALSPFNGYGIERVDALSVNTWNKIYYAAYMSFEHPVGQLSLYECGPIKAFCHKIHTYCDTSGHGSSGKLTWSDDRLTLSVQVIEDVELYQRFKTEDGRFNKEIGSNWLTSDFHSGGVCRYSLWG